MEIGKQTGVRRVKAPAVEPAREPEPLVAPAPEREKVPA